MGVFVTHDEQDQELIWELVDYHEARDQGLFPIKVKKLVSPKNGKVYSFYVYESVEWVAVIPLTSDNQVVMVRQQRHGTSEITLELPGGLCKEGLEPIQCAMEELEEETGYRSANWELMTKMDPLPALFNNRLHIFIARNAEPSGDMNQDETEAVQTVTVPLSKIGQYLRDGRVTSCIHVAALYYYLDQKDI
jgi:8-oxo-dGTP pyrophosphatase MutT (NUDIX family)